MFSNSNLLELSDIFFKNTICPKTKLYVVGGSVRDFLLGRTAADFDICSNLIPAEIEAILKNTDFEVDVTSKKYGMVIIKKSEFRVEHSTFRIESYKLDGTHTPTSLNFTRDIKQDAFRRDFTMNSIYYSLRDNEYLDFWDGRTDLKKRLIKTIKPPKQSFNEDAERILRLIRFAAKLDLSIEKTTLNTAKQNTALIENLSPGRIYRELNLMLLGKDTHKFIPNNLYMPLNSLIMHDDTEEDRTQFGSTGLNLSNQKQAIKLLNLFGISKLLFGQDLIYPKFAATPFNFNELYYANNNSTLLNLLKSGKEKQEFLASENAMNVILKSTPEMFKFNICFYYKYLFATINILRLTLGGKKFRKIEDIINNVSSRSLILSTNELKIKGDKLVEIGIKNTEIEKVKLILLKAVIDKKVFNSEKDLLNYITENDLLKKGR